ncbi:MAG: PrgI family protein, partial [Bacteroidales bacterium]|nr:PrgI family protein [Bacteroidales bacterium]
MAYISVPEDLTKVKNKVFLNLTLRQIVSVAIFGGLGVLVFFLTNSLVGTTGAGILLVAVATPGFLFAGYQRHGLYFEYILRNMLDVYYLRPKIRRYETKNFYLAAAKPAETKKKRSPGPKILGTNRSGKKKKKRKPRPTDNMKKIDKMTAQESIRYKEMSKDGICWVGGKTYSKTIRFLDITYQLAQSEDQADIFSHWCEFLNYFDDTIHVQLSFVNHHAGIEDFQKSVQISQQGDAYDAERLEYSRILQEQLTRGNNGLVRSKYITYSLQAGSLKEARHRLNRIESDILNNFKNMGVRAFPLSGTERLALMYETFHPEGTKFTFDYDDLLKSGLTTKDYIAPSSFTFKTGRTFTMGHVYGQVSYLQILASELSDGMLTEFLESENEMIINFHIQSIEQSEAVKKVKAKLTDINRMKIEEQKRAARSGYDINIIPTDLNLYADKAQEMLKDLQERNERMFMVTILFLNTGKTREALNNAVQQLNGIAQKHNCNLECLDFMQEKGLNASLPLGYSDVPIDRGLTTTSTAIFIPFTTTELFMDDPEAVYYGLNALSSNMILASRKALKNPNGLILGTPGAGKSFAAKREILNVFLVSRDDIIICDPEGEYGPLVSALGGQVINISSTSKDYINPLDINMDYSEEDSPLAVKSDFILSMYELMSSDRTGVSPEE